MIIDKTINVTLVECVNEDGDRCLVGKIAELVPGFVYTVFDCTTSLDGQSYNNPHGAEQAILDATT